MAKQNEAGRAAQAATEFATTASELDFLKRVQEMRQEAADKQRDGRALLDKAGTILFDMYFMITQRETVLLHKAIAEKESAAT